MAPRPLLGELELEKVQSIVVDGDQVLVEHGVPALEGNFLQRLGRRASKINLRGFVAGSGVLDSLKQLRDKLRAAEPVSFVADIATATRVDQVLIEEMSVRELAGKPERFEYAFLLREFIPPPPTAREQPPEPVVPPPPSVETGTLIVDVVVEGEPNFDFSTVTVSVTGTEESGASLTRTLSNRIDNRWTEEEFPPGQFMAEAVVTEPEAMSGSVQATIQAGQSTVVSITLRSGVTIAKAFVINFRFDNSFIEPCMRSVMQEVANYARDHGDEKLLIVGHTDKAGSHTYNQSLSERRARSAYAYLTYVYSVEESINAWDQLRRTRTIGQATSVNDSWGTFQYQHILQYLDYYPGEIDGSHGSLTNSAVELFRCDNGLPPGTTVDDQTWEKLIEKYLEQEGQGVPQSQFFPNTDNSGCSDGIVKWLGCGEEDPLREPRPPTERPHRQYRRVEFLFVQAGTIPCDNIPEPDTFRTALSPGSPVPSWCLGSGTTGPHCCFLTRDPDHRGSLWRVTPVVQTRIDVNGTLSFEGFEANKRVKMRLNITAPDGEYVDGEDASGSRKGLSSGRVLQGQTDASGNASFQFSYTNKPVGVYTLEIEKLSSSQIGPFVIYLTTENFTSAKGNSVCKSLRSHSDHLDITLPNVPALSEIRLPVVAHLMTARVDRFSGVEMMTPLHRTERTEATLQRLFERVNTIWRQARIEFELKDIVAHSYEPPAPVQQEVTEAEFNFLMAHCAYPNVINVFLVENLVDQTAFFAVSRDSGSAEAGCILRDLDNDQLSTEFLGQALGGVLNLNVLTDPATLDRLMHGGIVRTDTRLIESEVTIARSSRSSQQQCFPLTVTVNGATQIGGEESPTYIVVQQGGEVVVEAEVPPDQLALGTLVLQGGNVDPVNPHSSRIDRNALGRTEATATFTMNVPVTSGSPPQVYTRKVRIYVVEFNLEVESPACLESGSNEFIVLRHPTEQITITARIPQLILCIPDDLVQWQGGRLDPDDPDFPLQVKVSKPNVQRLTVFARLAGTERSVIIRVIQIDMIEVHTAATRAITFARVGLWDRSFNPATGNLRNGIADNNNFISLDSRKFHFRVRDSGASGEVTLRWRTVFEDGSDDDAPLSQDISLLETGSGTGVFISKAVFLVTDNTDRNQRTNSGLPPAHSDAGPRNRGQSNHRIRKITVNNTHQLDNKILAECSPTSTTRPAASASIFVFNRTPEQRRRISVHLVNVRNRIDGVGILTNHRRDLVIQAFQSIYAVCGIYAEVDEIILDPLASSIGWPMRYPGDTIAIDPSVEGRTFSGGISTPSASEIDIMNKVRARLDYNTNDIYIVCVAHIFQNPVPPPPGSLRNCCGGHAFADIFTNPGSPNRGFAFVAINSGITEYADVHEASHITTNFGHFDLQPTSAGAPGNIDGKNLMHRFLLRNNLGVSNPKRLWNRNFNNTHTSHIIPAQINRIRASRYVHNF